MRDKAFMNRVIKDNPEWVDRFNSLKIINESYELQKEREFLLWLYKDFFGFKTDARAQKAINHDKATFQLSKNK